VSESAIQQFNSGPIYLAGFGAKWSGKDALWAYASLSASDSELAVY